MGIIKVSFYSKGRHWCWRQGSIECVFMFFSFEGSSEVFICLCPQVLKPVVSPEVNHGLGNRRLINFSLSGTIPTSFFLSFHPSPYCFSPELEGHLISAFTHIVLTWLFPTTTALSICVSSVLSMATVQCSRGKRGSWFSYGCSLPHRSHLNIVFNQIWIWGYFKTTWMP